jgi:hypothetical protein
MHFEIELGQGCTAKARLSCQTIVKGSAEKAYLIGQLSEHATSCLQGRWTS